MHVFASVLGGSLADDARSDAAVEADPANQDFELPGRPAAVTGHSGAAGAGGCANVRAIRLCPLRLRLLRDGSGNPLDLSPDDVLGLASEGRNLAVVNAPLRTLAVPEPASALLAGFYMRAMDLAARSTTPATAPTGRLERGPRFA